MAHVDARGWLASNKPSGRGIAMETRDKALHRIWSNDSLLPMSNG